MAETDSEHRDPFKPRHGRKLKVLAITVSVIIAFLVFFVFIPFVSISTHPANIPQLAFLQIPASESLSCAVFGIGAANWPVPSNPTWQGTFTYRYQIGCPPVATSISPSPGVATTIQTAGSSQTCTAAITINQNSTTEVITLCHVQSFGEAG